jgi:hypothetical protein
MYSLVLEKMSEIDFGEYLCEARNSLGSGKAHLQISGKKDLKGQCHEISTSGFFMNQFPPSP